MSQSSTASDSEKHLVWWVEPQFFLVLLLGIGTYCLRISDVQLYGEEPRRALIAREMIESGDWIVPGTQGVFLPSRPPLQNWLIAIVGLIVGSVDILAARLPSLLLTIALAAMIYGYLRQTIGTLGSSTGAVSYLTMQLVMEFGRSAETEAVFTAFVGASMLIWHWAWMKKWPAWKMWCVAYAFVALGMLTKGLQAPVYFAGSTVLFLLATGNWRAILTLGHLMGILTFCLIFGAWQGVFTWQRGITDSWNIYFSDVADRFLDKSWRTFLTHLVAYPAELMLVRTMPWSVLLLAFASRNIRNNLGRRRESILFLSICILFSFIFVWLPPLSKVRYYMPLFPCFAALIGLAMDCLWSEEAPSRWVRLWPNFVQINTYAMVGVSVIVLTTSFLMPSLLFALPIAAAATFTVIVLGLAYIARKSVNDRSESATIRGVFCIGIFCALVQVSLVTVVQQRRCVDIAGSVNEFKQKLPQDAQLVSLGQVHHAFAYFYRKPIRIVDQTVKLLPEGVEYFCIHRLEPGPPELPFAWTQIAEVPVDRYKVQPMPTEFAFTRTKKEISSSPKERVFVGRRGTDPNAEVESKSTELN